MARMKSNTLLPILGGLVLLTAGVVGANGLLTDDMVTPQPRTSLPTPGDLPDGDTPADTIRTLNAKLEEVNQRLESVVGQNDDLQKRNENLRGAETKLRSDLSAEIEKKLTEVQKAQSSKIDSSVSFLGDQLNALKSSLVQKADSAPSIDLATDYPVSGGLAETGLGQGYVWVQPLDAGLGGAGVSQEGALAPFNPSGAATPLAAGSSQTAASPIQAPVVEPYFTINNLATLVDSVTWTAMVGRVPIRGQVSDPLPFRVLVGRENLAASGLRVPEEIAGMVFEGIAIGDSTLDCVEGRLRTATFVFQDGTIRTVEGDLGYVSDEFGALPCVQGERVSNAAQYLTTAVALAAGAGAAQGFAAAETAQVVDGSGAVSAVVGNAAKFALGNAATEGLNEIQKYLADRLNSTFDAVVAPAGRKINVLIQQEISIDYDPRGRRLDYAKGNHRQPGNLD